ncbi:MAG TPA: gliding motility-associated C-terminal domain-containing protein [Flavobacteriales bacterium]|nr:gliding motility-associated C-terminal domain-containing protein [Flavobacteriales bacterium]
MRILRLLTVLSLPWGLGVHAQSASHFVENKGQWPASVEFRTAAPEATVWCEAGSILIDRFDAAAIAKHHAGSGSGYDPQAPRTIRHHALRLHFPGATGPVRSEGQGLQAGRYNYFLGNDPRQWASNARAYAMVLQQELYPGIDLRLRPGDGVMKYDLIVAPGADPSQIRVAYEGAEGIQLRDGRLVIGTSLGDLIDEVPLAFQIKNGERVQVECRYTLKKGAAGFLLGPYDPTLELVIDPSISFSSYSGSTSDNFGYTATSDDAGFLYSGSSAFGQGYPTTTGAYDVSWNGGTGNQNAGTDIALTKWDTTGSFLVWSTFIGGGGDDLPHSLIVNADNELIMLGTTGSSNYPTTPGAFQSTSGGGTSFTPIGIGTRYPQGTDMVLSRLSADGSQLLASTYIGGSANDGLNNAAALHFNYADEMRGEVDLTPAGNIVVASCTQSTDFPTTPGAYRTTYAGGSHDAVLFEFNPSLTTLHWSTYFGGTLADAAYSLEVDSHGDILISGGTTSTNLPTTPGAINGANNGGQADAFVAKFNATGSALLASTYYGSAAYDQFYFVSLDHDDNVYLFGQTSAPAGLLIAGATYFQSTGGQLLAKFTNDLSSVIWSSRFGALSGPGVGIPNISPTAFLVDYCNKIYISGWGSQILGSLTTTGMPVTADAFQSTTDGNDFYLAVFDINMTGLSYATYFGGAQSLEHVDGGTSRFDRRGRVYGAVCAGCGHHHDFPTTPGAWSSTNNSANCNLGVFKFDFDAPLVIAGLAATVPACAGSPVQFSNLGNLGTSWLWDFGDGSTSTAHAPAHTYANPGIYTVSLTAYNPDACNGQDSASIQVQVLQAAPVLLPMPDISVCGTTDSLLLVAATQGGATDWQWSSSPLFLDTLNLSPSDSTATLSPVIPGTYHVQASVNGGCTATGHVVVSASLAQAAISPDLSICADDTALITLTGIDAGSTIQWEPAALIIQGQGSTQVLVAPPTPTMFTATVTSPTGCVWADSTFVDVSLMGANSVTATADPMIVVPGSTVHLQATPTTGVTYAWQPAGIVSDPAIANPTAVVHQTTTFIVTVSDGTCTAMDSVTVKVHELICDDPDIFVPDAFTPNGDGSNDVLFVRGRHISAMELKVFDRWGELVFTSTDPADGWDGSYKGKPVDPAVFVYWLKVECVDGQSFFTKGNVTVIR